MNYCDLEYHARKAEQKNDWREAARLWKLAGRIDDSNACTSIVKANEIGDNYRNMVLQEAGPEPSPCDNPHKWVKWYDTMTSIYNKIFRK